VTQPIKNDGEREQPFRVAVYLPNRLERDLKAIASRDRNGLSATARRLLAAAIAEERRSQR
jgi:hypothetical protein